ncbi:hypothetical protein MRX96_023470 [Rhipicephalus microplus]
MQVDTGSPRDNHHMAYLPQIPSPLASAPEDYLATDLFPRSTSRQGSTQYLGDVRWDHTGRYLGGAGVLWTGSVWAGRHQSPRTAWKAGSRRRNEGCPGKPSSTKYDLQVQQLLDEFQDLFSEELGLIKGPPVELRLREDLVPRFFKARAVPYGMREAVSQEIDRLVQTGILTPVACAN